MDCKYCSTHPYAITSRFISSEKYCSNEGFDLLSTSASESRYMSEAYFESVIFAEHHYHGRRKYFFHKHD